MNIKETIEVFKKCAIFDGLGETELKKMAQGCSEQSFPMGSVIIEENDPPKEMLFVIKMGEIVVSTGPADVSDKSDTESGGTQGETMITTLGPGEAFGEIALIDELPHSASVKTMSDTIIVVLPSLFFQKLVEEDKNIGYIITRNIAKLICKRLRDSNFITRHFVQWGAPDNYNQD
jgi:CRP-like cAMP-binding protein